MALGLLVWELYSSERPRQSQDHGIAGQKPGCRGHMRILIGIRIGMVVYIVIHRPCPA